MRGGSEQMIYLDWTIEAFYLRMKYYTRETSMNNMSNFKES